MEFSLFDYDTISTKHGGRFFSKNGFFGLRTFFENRDPFFGQVFFREYFELRTRTFFALTRPSKHVGKPPFWAH